MKKFLVTFIFILFGPAVYADLTPPSFCDIGSESMTGGSCFSTCSAVSANSSAHLGAGSSGVCIAQASYRKFTVYSLAIGSESSGNESLCEIWSGALEIQTAGQSIASQIGGGAIDLTSCPAGTYDVLFLTSSRFWEFELETVYPDGSGKELKSTSTFAAPNTSADYAATSTFVEVSASHSDDTKGYVRPSAGFSNIYMKLGNAPISTDLASNNASRMYYDWAKAFAFYGSTSFRSGWYCDGSDNVCDRVNPSNSDHTDLRLTADAGIIDGLPFTLTGDEETLDFEISYHSANRGNNEELGTEVAFVNDGGTIKAIGVKPGESGAYGTISNIK